MSNMSWSDLDLHLPVPPDGPVPPWPGDLCRRCAHQVSPFGARGANSGMQDIDNLGWKLALVMDGLAPEPAGQL
jgi:hypothetical protein